MSFLSSGQSLAASISSFSWLLSETGFRITHHDDECKRNSGFRRFFTILKPISWVIYRTGSMRMVRQSLLQGRFPGCCRPSRSAAVAIRADLVAAMHIRTSFGGLPPLDVCRDDASRPFPFRIRLVLAENGLLKSDWRPVAASERATLVCNGLLEPTSRPFPPDSRRTPTPNGRYGRDRRPLRAANRDANGKRADAG